MFWTFYRLNSTLTDLPKTPNTLIHRRSENNVLIIACNLNTPPHPRRSSQIPTPQHPHALRTLHHPQTTPNSPDLTLSSSPSADFSSSKCSFVASLAVVVRCTLASWRRSPQSPPIHTAGSVISRRFGRPRWRSGGGVGDRKDGSGGCAIYERSRGAVGGGAFYRMVFEGFWGVFCF